MIFRSGLLLATLFVVLTLSACSTTPDNPVTREMLMKTKIYGTYTIEESPEEVLDEINKYGEAILKVNRSIKGTDYPMHLKILATSGGLEVLEYDR